MIIEMFLLKNVNKKPESVMVELTPETLAEENSLRNAKILHKNQIGVYWGDTLELSKPTGCRESKHRKDEYIGFSGLKVNFKLPRKEKPIVAKK